MLFLQYAPHFDEARASRFGSTGPLASRCAPRLKLHYKLMKSLFFLILMLSFFKHIKRYKLMMWRSYRSMLVIQSLSLKMSKGLLKPASTKSNLWIIFQSGYNGFHKVKYTSCGVPSEDYRFVLMMKLVVEFFERRWEWWGVRN